MTKHGATIAILNEKLAAFGPEYLDEHLSRVMCDHGGDLLKSIANKGPHSVELETEKEVDERMTRVRVYVSLKPITVRDPFLYALPKDFDLCRAEPVKQEPPRRSLWAMLKQAWRDTADGDAWMMPYEE